ncbi:hypothetical protein RFI_34586 [Reticulomyxa filosa]|uniref:Uncharacterized protein n=1 Tax=Reticulomyxa filosa TaxID=46433 RepID=X6LNV9_RETFI|nr:hypothetical protein RFI_34586 [Reticulomyxa filosa]|eukprot:ETO02827.1 hypothetical protein RFI_34586 [Reticulomyxa filosa]
MFDTIQKTIANRHKKKTIKKISTEENEILKIFCNSLKNIGCNYFNLLKQQSKIKHILQCLHLIKSNKFNITLFFFNQTF